MQKSPISQLGISAGKSTGICAVVYSVLLLATVQLFGQSPEAALRYLEEQEKPDFRDRHNLPPLSHWRVLSPEVAKVLAVDWGFALPILVRPDFVEQLDDPESDSGKIVRWVREEPETYSLQLVVMPDRVFGYGLEIDDLPEGTFYRDANGNLVDGEHYFSPLAPNAAFVRIGEVFGEMIKEFVEYAPVSVILNGGEYGLKKPYFVDRSVAEQDPDVMEAWRNDGRSWIEFISAHKARQERIIRRSVLRAAPDALYIHYSEVGGGHTRRKMAPDWEDHDFLYQPGVSDLGSPPLYYRHANSGFTGPRDMLTQLLNARAQEIAMGVEFAYPWVSAGWYRRGSDTIANTDLYEGFLRMCYMAGSTGTIAGYFGARPYHDPVEASLPQFLAQSRTHALFSHLDTLLLNSRLLPGPDRHRWSRDLPAYEYPTGHRDKRVLVRRHDETNEWLVGAWAADGNSGDVEIVGRDFGKLTVKATPAATIYLIEEDGSEYSKTVIPR